MLSALAATAPWVHGPGFFPFFFLVPLFWILLFVVLFLVVGRRRRRWLAEGGWNQGHSAEATLAERFANGDIDEVEYRARLEVLRANRERPR